MKKNRQLDSYDLNILQILCNDGRLPVTAIAESVGLSKTPCQRRIQRLQAEGFIKGYKAILDHQKLGRDHIAFAEVTLSDTREHALQKFNEAVATILEIEECHMIAGSFDYLLKVRTADINAYRKVLGESISSLPHVANSSTYVAMQSIKEAG